MLTHLQQTNHNTIIDGYIRENYGDDIINDICNLCCKYLNEIFHLKFDQKAIQKLKSIEEGEKILGNGTIHIRGIDFEYYLIRFPGNNANSCHLQISPCIKSKIYSSHFCIVYEIYCDELKYGDASNYEWNERDHIAYEAFSEEELQDSQSCVPPSEAETQMDVTLLEIQEYKTINFDNLETLTFRVYADFVFITYDNYRVESFRDVKLSRIVEYKWQIDDYLANELMNAKEGDVFYSDNFGNMQEENVYNQHGFCLVLTPKCKNGHRFALRYIVLPEDIDCIRECTVWLSNGLETGVHSRGYWSHQTWRNTVISVASNNDIEAVLAGSREFSVKIEIGTVEARGRVVFVKGRNDDKMEWKRYGLL